MKVIVVTGGIGSGKSQVCRILEEKYGIPVYEADRRAKCLYSEIPELLASIEVALGCKLRDDSGEFKPQSLAEIIFSDPAALKEVESLLFPAMMTDFGKWAELTGRQVVAFESATILEKKQFDGFGDIVLLVDAPMELRIARAIERDGVDKDAVLRRISVQPLMNRLSEGENDSRVDFILANDSTFENLEEKLKKFIEKYSLTKMLL